ncbi:MAG: hypothetical protein RLZZ582_633, partial [Verrucomicrobiota bacterium]
MTEDESSKRLQQLLRLKRHETPPPGYFNDLSSGVMDRIRALEAERNTPLWRRWFFLGSDSQSAAAPAGGLLPVWVWNGLGLAMMATLLGGIYWASGTNDSPNSEGMPSQQAAVTSPGLSRPSEAFSENPSIALSGSSWDSISSPQYLRAAAPLVHERFRVPVSVSMSSPSAELSST